MSDPLKKPVHVALLKPVHISRMLAEGRLQVSGSTVLKTPPTQPLPRETPKAMARPAMPRNLPSSAHLSAQAGLRVKLRVMYDKVPALPPEKVPPCNTCKTAACCSAFLVAISAEEYNSGAFGEFAVKITEEVAEQLSSSQTMLIARAQIPFVTSQNETRYVLEGVPGQPCPFLEENNRCGIYEHRPLVCRVYTCVDDPRITEEMRQGTTPTNMGGNK